ncbi:MAG: hypothetical protein A2Y48_05150 [Nitrospirae bacterium RIFCSPLOW2_12_42_9]|nr:MAG: hypothetical protein A2035_03885 [Nitrospirae bacterium GWA2_42_11]OGW57097.1 MAG: hypothetical protein A3D21_01920 [Nitrospirae bacterium RIFCSPHIGHO2_02_FULL_42_12]OGW58149.1 MAG: hypothetical protein A2Y48_05150 [Nitrospirae bacterium RIFCSPLOW2_12_42_9]HBI23065.1 hypothetical protein [Nitrospiraceae bacterium]HKZ57270.1 hypothetical protein [Thermodesulfovibrionales bacterium]
MKILANKRLFGFLREGTLIDLSKQDHLNMFVQQTLLKGRTSDIKNLFKTISYEDFIYSLSYIKNSLPVEINRFWEEWLADINAPAD